MISSSKQRAKKVKQQDKVSKYPETHFIPAIVVFEARFSNVQVSILIAIVMMRSIPCSLKQRPEALDRVCVNIPIDKLFLVINGVMKNLILHCSVCRILIGHQNGLGKINLPFQEILEILIR